MNSRLVVVALSGVLVAPAAAEAVIAVSPMNDAPTNGHPILTWSLAPGETMGTVEISRLPATTPAGDFFDENQVAFGAPADTATSWSPTSLLFAGRYWWSAKAYDVDFNAAHTPPASFVVQTEFRGARWGWTRYAFLRELDLSARWVTNAPTVKVTFRVTRNGKTLWVRSRTQPTLLPLERDQVTVPWKNRQVKRGRKIRVSVAIRVGGRLVASASKITKAP